MNKMISSKENIQFVAGEFFEISLHKNFYILLGKG
jgi:hypothetical protein